MTHSNNDIEQLEELLTELEGQEARIITPYSEEDDAVTRLMDAPLGDQDWMVQVTALDRRMMSTSQVLSELAAGKISPRTLVWRGGMDDWLPLARVEELSRASAPPASMSRPAYNFAPPPPPPAPAAPRSQPMWASAPSAPLPPPPVAMAPPIGMAPAPSMLNGPPAQSGMRSSSVGGAPPPSASIPSFNAQLGVPVSAPVPEVPSFSGGSFSGGNTARPVAVDFSDLPEANAPLQSKRWVMALSAVAILAVFVTVYSLSSGGDESDAPVAAVSSSSAKPASAAQPASAPVKEKAASAAASAPRPEPVAAAPAPAEEEEQAEANDDDDSTSRSRSRARQNVPARYSARSELRRRSRGSSSSSRSQSEAEDRRAPVALAAVAARPEASEEQEPTSEPAAAVADEVDEPPKSTSKGSTFDREAAKAALDDAASQAKNCRPAGGPSGSGRVQIRYEPSGKVANVTILTSKFDNTTTGSCVRMLFRRAKVPEFTGAPAVVVNKSFEIP